MSSKRTGRVRNSKQARIAYASAKETDRLRTLGFGQSFNKETGLWASNANGPVKTPTPSNVGGRIASHAFSKMHRGSKTKAGYFTQVDPSFARYDEVLNRHLRIAYE